MIIKIEKAYNFDEEQITRLNWSHSGTLNGSQTATDRANITALDQRFITAAQQETRREEYKPQGTHRVRTHAILLLTLTLNLTLTFDLSTQKPHHL